MDELIRLDRRDILKATTGILAGLVVAGSSLALIARGRAWAIAQDASVGWRGCGRGPF
jgi:hypothetical protein